VSVVADFTARRGDFALTFRADLQAGSIVAVLGPNGSGKTTLLRTLSGLAPLHAGSLTIDGRTVDDERRFVPPQERSVGVVFQDYALFPHLSVLENVAFGPRSTGTSRSTARAASAAMLGRLGIADLAARRPLTPYVASLMGVTLVRGTVTEGVIRLDDGGELRAANRDVSGRALAVIRPEAVTIHRQHPEGSARNVWQGTITGLQPAHDRVRVLVDGQPPVIAAVTPSSVAELSLVKGSQVWLSVKAVDVDVYSTPAH
jgi:molybdopterin-binding protein